MYMNLPATSGTYAVLYLCVEAPKNAIAIGKRMQLRLRPGYYLYVGSAFGSGGLSARVHRHLRREKSKRWHVDYLSDYVAALGAYYIDEPKHLEHQWAAYFKNLRTCTPVPNFGCSDCKCQSHLFHFPPFSKHSVTQLDRIDSITVKYFIKRVGS